MYPNFFLKKAEIQNPSHDGGPWYDRCVGEKKEFFLDVSA